MASSFVVARRRAAFCFWVAVALALLASAFPAAAQVGDSSQVVNGSTPTCYYTSGLPNSATQCYSSAAAVMAAVAATAPGTYTDIYGNTYVETWVVDTVPADTGTGYIAWTKCPKGSTSCSTGRNGYSIGKRAGSYTCPDSATLSGGVCYCPAGKRPNAAKSACEQNCVAGQTVSEGYYDIGTNAQATPLLGQCKNGCWAVFDGTSPEGSAMVDNTKHWYAKGFYANTGAVCTSSTATPDGLTTIPQDSCDTTKYDKGTVNGKTVCTLKGTDTPATPAPAASSSTSTNSTTTTNSDGSTTKTDTTTTTNADGSSSTTTTTTTTKPDGSSSSTSTTTVTPSPTQSDDTEKTACEKNPSGAGCGGDAASIGSSWTARSTGKTFSTVLTQFSTSVQATPLFSSMRGFFTVSSGGACPRWSANVPYLNTTISMDTFCSEGALTAYAIARAAVLLVATWLAFRIAADN